MNFLSGYKKAFTIQRKNGFSIVELSVILAILAATIMSIAAWLQPPVATNALRTTTTHNRLDDIGNAMNLFYSRYGRLPCPADPKKLANKSYYGGGNDIHENDFGVEDLDRDKNDNTDLTYGTDCELPIGLVPVHSLGLDETHINDGWGRRLTYHVSPNLCGTDNLLSSGTSTDQDLIRASRHSGCTPQSFDNNNGNLRILNEDDDIITEQAAFVVVSHGANGRGALLPSGERIPVNEENALEQENNDDLILSGNNWDMRTGGASFLTYRLADSNPEPLDATADVRNNSYDDIVFYRTKAQIQQEVFASITNIVDEAFCNENSDALENLDLANSTQLRDNINEYERVDRSNNYVRNTGDSIMLDLLYTTQNLCIQYYTDSARGQWRGPRCPGGATYDREDGSCICDGDNWNNC